MNKRLFLATSAAVAIATSALAQSSPSNPKANPPPSQGQPDSASTTKPANSAKVTSPSSNNSAQTQAPRPENQNAAGQSTNSGTSTSQAPDSTHSPNQAQTNTSSNTRTQSSDPKPGGDSRAEQSQTGSSSANTAQQPSGQTTAEQPTRKENTAERSSNTNVNASVNINDQQRTRINQSISHLNVQPLNSVNFSLSVGTAVPRDVRLQPLPAEVVSVVPQYRGYDFVLVKDEIVIVEPSSYKIVAVLPYSGRSTATAPARTEQHKVTFSDRDREVIRKHAKSRPVERQTTGHKVTTEIRTGERVPEGVEIEAFPEEVYRESPSLKDYRYISRDSRTYIVEPQERRVIEEVD